MVLLNVKIPLPLVQVLAIRILIDNGARSSVCALLAMALLTNLEPVTNGALFTVRNLFSSVGNGATNVPRYWHLSDDACIAVETRYTTFFQSIRCDEFHGRVSD